MPLAAILGLASAFVSLVRVIIEKYVPDKQMPTFRKAGKIGVNWTHEKIQAIGRKRGLLE